MTQLDPARRRMMIELADWHAEWARKWNVDDHYYEGESLATWEGRIPPEAEADYRQRADEIMARHRGAATADAASAPGGTPGQPLPAPRSRDEAVFYMDLHPCPRCGQQDTRWSAALAPNGAELVRRYEGACGGCGQGREYVFRLGADSAPRPPGVSIWYGGEAPSQLIDAGQWLWMYERTVAGARAERARGDASAAARSADLAVAFVAEALKFVPDNAEEPPASAFWSPVGRELHAADPRRFTRRRLNLVLNMLREEFAESAGDVTPSGLAAVADPAARPPLGRSSEEIHLYLDLHPCECGEGSFDRSRQLHEANGELVARYQAACPQCGRERRFAFRLPDEPLVTIEGTGFRYGGAQPSELLDPGEWLLAADTLAKSVPLLGPATTTQERERFRFAIGRAAAAIDEVAKFAPPGATEVPLSAISSERGHAVYHAEPGRFRLARLDVVRSTYRRLLVDAGLD